ncbi:MAG TPA: 3-isopropylmalate dehydratase large subunit [Thermoanaerobaculia bacterium]|nr:3-isopropylmalate dehydratase large subunit [Thermoanaerobaculia bacterium]
MTPRTLFQKIWDRHVVIPPGGPDTPGEPGMPAVLAIDLHLVHEVTSPQAFTELERRGLRVRRPDRTVATMDHSTPTEPGITRERLRVIDAAGAAQLDRLEENCRRHGIPLHALGSEHQGIVHVMGPELGLTQPGMTIVCGDSHTSTHGAFGALAFGIGTSEVGHVLATQCLVQHRPKTFEVRVDGRLGPLVSAKDLILAVIAEIGIEGGTGCVFEYTGEAIRTLDMEGRMTVCNMSIEGGARAGMIAPDETTFAWLEGRPHAPTGAEWQAALERWRELPSDPGARYDREVVLDGAAIEPMITWGTNPGMAIPIHGRVPVLAECEESRRPALAKALGYMDLRAGEPVLGRKIDVVFVGSCTNSRYSDLEAAARVLDGRRVAPGVRMLVVPGSQQVKRRAEETGLADVFRAAGAEWREAGCSMCLAMNQDRLEPGQYAVSTTNRNFEGRQGPGGRTFLASPLTAAASAVAGHIADVREIL